jgi:8-oxo-dGTP diphosphatase
MLTVVAAIIESHGKLLVCQRRKGDRFELLWEFPGGKKKPGETSREALARELIEELGVEAKIGREVHRVQHEYAEMSEPIELIFFAATVDSTAVRNLVFEQIQWRDPDTLGELEFLPADRPLVEQLANGKVRLNPTEPPADLTESK